MGDPVGRKRDVCCEPFYVPCFTCKKCYRCTHPKREVPYDDDDPRNTKETKEVGVFCQSMSGRFGFPCQHLFYFSQNPSHQVYEHYEALRIKQIEAYETFYGPVRNSTVCRGFGCRRFFGRRGCIFCTEGCCTSSKKPDEPAPPFEHRDIDDENDASVILRKVLGDPPVDVVYKKWELNEQGENIVVALEASSSGKKQEDAELGLVCADVETGEVEIKPHDE